MKRKLGLTMSISRGYNNNNKDMYNKSNKGEMFFSQAPNIK